MNASPAGVPNILPADDAMNDGRRVIVYLPACAEREFGSTRRSLASDE
jgi:hypothetical protein